MASLAVLLILDGARPDLLEYLAGIGFMPNLAKLVREGCYQRVVSVFPSTTGPAHLPFLTGCHPGVCNIPGIRWQEPHGRSQAYTSLWSHLGRGINRDLSRGVSTLFELYPSACVFEPVSRGADLRLPPWGQGVSHLFNTWIQFDRLAMKLTRQLASQRRYRLIVTLLCGVDELSHRNHCHHPLVFQAYRAFDRQLGELIQTLEGQDYLLAIVSDHGLTDTSTHIDLVRLIKKTGLKVRSYPLNFRNGQDVFVAESGNSMAHIYLETPGNLGKIKSKLQGQQGIDLLITKNESGVHVQNKRGEAVIYQHGERYRYQTIQGDPLGLEGFEGVWLNREESLSVTAGTRYPDSLYQFTEIFQSPRCGDLIVTAEEGFDLRVLEFPEHHASHGSPLQGHMWVPLVLNKKVEVRTTDEVYGLIRSYLDREAEDRGMD